MRRPCRTWSNGKQYVAVAARRQHPARLQARQQRVRVRAAITLTPHRGHSRNRRGRFFVWRGLLRRSAMPSTAARRCACRRCRRAAPPTPTQARRATKAQVCAACHGAERQFDRSANIPILAGPDLRATSTSQLQGLQGRPAQRSADVARWRRRSTRDDMHGARRLLRGAEAGADRLQGRRRRRSRAGRSKADEVLCTMCHLGGFVGPERDPARRGPALRLRRRSSSRTSRRSGAPTTRAT